MAQTVIGLFDNEKEAQQAVQQLFNDGFNDNNVDVNTRYEDTNRIEGDVKKSDKENGFVRFFNNLFGTDEADKYSKVAERCSSIVTVHADSSDEAERAADILDLYGAVDVDKKASEFGYSSDNPNYDTDRNAYPVDRTVDRTFPADRENFVSDTNLEYGNNYDTDRTSIVESAREKFNTEKSNEFNPDYLKSENQDRTFVENQNRNVDTDLGIAKPNLSTDYSDSDIRRDELNSQTSPYSGRENRNIENSNIVRDDLNSEYTDDRVRNDLEANVVNPTSETRPFIANENRSLDKDSELYRGDRDRNFTDSEKSIPVIEENLNIGKQEVETGGVRLRSRIIERPIEESLRLRQERVRVERNPVDREATEADFRSFKEGEIELTERGEVPLVSKEARVVEEVRLRKDVEDRSETVRDTVRKTEVDVENFRKDGQYRTDEKV